MAAELSEVLLIETLRRYIALLPQDKPGGWPAFGTRKLEKRWPFCIASPLTRGDDRCTCERGRHFCSVLAERFRRYLSETPIAYLTRWRLHLGAQQLTSTSNSVAAIATEVGYESEPSFNRAFKREFGLPPARFRSQSKSAHNKAVRQPS